MERSKSVRFRDSSLTAAALAVALVLGLGSASRADELAEKGRTISKQHQQAVVTVQVLVRSRVSMPGMAAQTNESHHSISGTVVSPSGLTAVSLSALDPGQALKTMAAARDPRLKVETELVTINLLLADGSQAAAEPALRDAELDLALLRPKTKLPAPVAAVDLTQSGQAEVLEQVVALNRLGPAAGRGYSASAERIAAIVEQPRRVYIPDANMTTATLGAPAFTLDGKLLGIFLIHSTGTNAPGGALDTPAESLTGIILPADAILKAIQRVPAGEAKGTK
jgi:hypothetical protein